MVGLVYTDESEASSFMKAVNKKRSSIGNSKNYIYVFILK